MDEHTLMSFPTWVEATHPGLSLLNFRQKTPPDLHPKALLDFKRKLVSLSKPRLV
jgi:Golgi nucleoside diphosphatase